MSIHTIDHVLSKDGSVPYSLFIHTADRFSRPLGRFVFVKDSEGETLGRTMVIHHKDIVEGMIMVAMDREQSAEIRGFLVGDVERVDVRYTRQEGKVFEMVRSYETD